jgi:hypothetical protein
VETLLDLAQAVSAQRGDPAECVAADARFVTANTLPIWCGE